MVSWRRVWRGSGLLLAAALLAGCVTPAQEEEHRPAEWPALRDCASWYRALDEAIEGAGVRDAQYARVQGFPYLRVDRFHSALRSRAGADDHALHALADAMLALDLESRRHEIRNLPPEALAALPGGAERDGPAEAYQRTVRCGRLLREVAFAKPDVRLQALRAAEVPDEYSEAARVLGLYALTRLALTSGVQRWEAEARKVFDVPAPVPAGAVVVRYAPPRHGYELPPVSRIEVANLLAHTDALGRPMLSARDLARLAIRFAPSFDVVTAADYDRFGELRWTRAASVPRVDAARLAVYVNPAYTLYWTAGERRVLLQLVYTAWFPERPARAAGDPYAGALDAVVWRVTLAPDGAPLLYDTMHACGCYHQFFPTPRARRRAAPAEEVEWAFTPATMPALHEGERPIVRIGTAAHAIEALSGGDGNGLVRYDLVEYDELRSLPTAEGGHRSVFGPDGLVAGTERAERFFLWPSGVRSAGAMRQWGRHATAFVGRRHFDDADLLARRFQLDLEGAAR